MRVLRAFVVLTAAAGVAGCSSRPATPDQPARVESTPAATPRPAGGQPGTPVRRPQAAAPTTQAPAQAAPAPAPAPTPTPAPAPKPVADAEAWRPAWWVDGVQRLEGRTVAGAMATEADLLAARRRAVDLAAAALEKALGRAPADTDTKVDTLRLADGRYRAFIVVSAPTN